MTDDDDDDDLDRCRVEMYCRVDVWIEALQELEMAEAAAEPGPIAEAEEAVLQAGMAIAEPAIRKALVSRMAAAIEQLDHLGTDDATMAKRALLMHRQFLIDAAPLGIAPVTECFIADADRELSELNEVEPRL